MIGYLRGRIVEQGEDTMTIDVGGVGYELTCSSHTLAAASEVGEIQLWVQTYVREDAISLFGFATNVEKRMFLSLTKAKGVGPKTAINILSATSIEQLAAMIEAGDVKTLSKLPKVGKKTAEQLILALKGQLVLARGDEDDSKKKPASAPVARFSGVRADVLSALVNLGFRLQDAEKAVADMPEDIDVQDGVRKGLQALTQSL